MYKKEAKRKCFSSIRKTDRNSCYEHRWTRRSAT